MANKVFKCALTGKVEEGEGRPFADVDTNAGVTLRVFPLVHTSGTNREQGVFCEEAVRKISEVLKVFVQPLEKKTAGSK